MMRAYDEAMAAAADRPAFSNGFEGERWMAQWCERCANDLSIDTDGGCPLLFVALNGKTPAEFIPGVTDEQGRVSLAQRYRCSEFIPADAA